MYFSNWIVVVVADAVSTLIWNSCGSYVIAVVPSEGLSGNLITTESAPDAAGVYPAQKLVTSGLLALIVPVVVIVAPVEKDIPVPAVKVETVPEPAAKGTQLITPAEVDCNTDVPVAGEVAGNVYTVFPDADETNAV